MINYKSRILNFKEKFLNKEFLINKALPIGSAIFFLVTKLFFNFLLWKDRILPPEAGDVFNYLRWIRLIQIDYLNLTPAYTFYTFLLGNIAKFFHLSAEYIFYYSFWFGLVFITFVLWRLFKSLKFNSWEILLGFSLLSFYTGNGAFNGFYWVVPSFFSVATILYLFSVVISKRKINWWFLGAISFIYPLIHGTGVFSLSILAFYVFFILIFNSFPKFSFSSLANAFKYIEIKRVALIIFIGFVSFYLVTILLPKINNLTFIGENDRMYYSQILPGFKKAAISKSVPFFYDENNIEGESSILIKREDVYNSVKNFRIIKSFFSEIQAGKIAQIYSIIWQRFQGFNFNYLNKIIPNYIALFAWFFIFYFLFYYKRYKILIIYFSFFLFSFFSSVLYYKGFKSLVYLWPVTYILIANSFYYICKFIKEWPLKGRAMNLKIFSLPLRRVYFVIFILLILIFYFFNLIYSFWYINLKNKLVNVQYNYEMFNGINNNYSTQDSVLYFDDYFTISEFLSVNYEKGYSTKILLSDTYQEDLKIGKRVVVFLKDDKLYYVKPQDDIWKNILDKILSFLPTLKLKNGNSYLNESAMSIEEKMIHFGIPSPQRRRDIYKDFAHYIFEII